MIISTYIYTITYNVYAEDTCLYFNHPFGLNIYFGGASNPASCGMWFSSQPRLRHKVIFLRTMGQLELLVGRCD